MLRMRQGLKCSRMLCNPFSRQWIFFAQPLHDFREEFCLGREGFGFQAFGLSGGADRGKIDLRGEVLFARPRQQIGFQMMTIICPQRSIPSLRGEELLLLESVIEGQQLAIFQRPRRLPPPFFGGVADLSRKTVGQDLQQTGRQTP